MSYGIKEDILKLNKKSYAIDNVSTEDLSSFIDCSAGINPLGFSKLVEEGFKNMDLELINLYPETSYDLKKSISDYWKDLTLINMDQILLGDGSIELIYKINKLLIDSESKVLGYSPQFSDYIDDVEACGGSYEYYLLNKENNFKFDPDLFLENMNKDHKLFYIDNPNNPTGQVIDIFHIEEIVKKAKRLSKFIIIDEAYGDFLDKNKSAISLINKYDNLIVIRTFSKGLGLAGVRAGYILASKKFTKEYLKVSNPYEMGSIARYLAKIAIEDINFMDESIKKLGNYKKRFIKSLNKLMVLETYGSVPIMTIMHPDPNVDLEKLLLKYKILSVSGKGFIGLGKNFVRVRLAKDIEKMIQAFKEAEDERI